MAAAVLSQPADTLLSKVSTQSTSSSERHSVKNIQESDTSHDITQINQGKGGHGGVLKRLGALAAEAGPVGLFVGLGPRIIMTAGQWDEIVSCTVMGATIAVSDFVPA